MSKSHTNVQDTSIETYRDISKTLGNKQRIVFKMLKRAKRPVTNRELSKALIWNINCVTGRVRELYDQGLIFIAYKRPCRIGGRTSIHWEVYKQGMEN